jgi:membrane protease YdiL (CAAX protease family)
MDRRLALGALLAIPVLYLLCRALSSALEPLAGGGVALMAYWAGLGAALRITQDPDHLRELLVAQRPGRLVTVMLALPVLALGALTLRQMGQVALPPHLVIAAALGAILHAALEETFWRGALLPRLSAGPAARALALYWVFHLGWLGLGGVQLGSAPWVLLVAPLALGGVWTAARLTSGTLGAAILSHAGVALFLFLLAIIEAQPAA